jgi:ATP-dependent RNA helicase DDX51/DBP6
MLIDILITTPGRLAEHILHTLGFTLQHLQFLVLDEADRLLHQSYQNWTELVMREISSPKVLQSAPNILDLLQSTDELPIIGQRHLDKLFGDTAPTTRSVRKFIFSATLTHDLGKLASLQIRDPEMISIQAEPSTSNQNPAEELGDDPIFSLPTTLREYAIAATDDKPLLLLHLLNKYRLQENTLIFTHSTETATRLNHLLSQFYKSIQSDVTTAVISSEVPLRTRKKLLSSLTSGKLNMYHLNSIS